MLKSGGLASFVTKQSPDKIAKKLRWPEYSPQWCGLDWDVEVKPMYLPYVDDCCTIHDKDSVAVHNPSELSLEERQHGCKLLYLYIARKSK